LANYCSERITPWPFSKSRLMLLFSYRSSLLKKRAFVLTNSSCVVLFDFGYKKSPFTSVC
ncbi:hypothetical protein KY382_31470, partial [Pseudomonas monteilii]|nr:hypothetical protein [Pseudomonas monteilii]